MRGMAVCFVFCTSRPRFASFYLPSFFVTPAVLDSLTFSEPFFFFNLFPISAAPQPLPPNSSSYSALLLLLLADRCNNNQNDLAQLSRQVSRANDGLAEEGGRS